MTWLDSRMGDIDAKFVAAGANAFERLADKRVMAEYGRLVGNFKSPDGQTFRNMHAYYTLIPELMRRIEERDARAEAAKKVERQPYAVGTMTVTTEVEVIQDIMKLHMADNSGTLVVLPVSATLRPVNASVWDYWLQTFWMVDSARKRMASNPQERGRLKGGVKYLTHKGFERWDHEGNKTRDDMRFAFMFCIDDKGRIDEGMYRTSLKRLLGYMAKWELPRARLLVSRHQLLDKESLGFSRMFNDNALILYRQDIINATHDVLHMTQHNGMALDIRIPDEIHDIPFTKPDYEKHSMVWETLKTS